MPVLTAENFFRRSVAAAILVLGVAGEAGVEAVCWLSLSELSLSLVLLDRRLSPGCASFRLTKPNCDILRLAYDVLMICS